MEKEELVYNNLYGEIKINDRKKVSLTGIKKLISFNPEEFVIETILGGLLLKGNSLEIVKLDTNDGILSIKGHIDSVCYTNTSKVKENIITRLFK